MPCHQNGDYLYNSCDIANKKPMFNVPASDVVVLSACDIPEGQSIPVLMGVGPVADDCWCPYSMYGMEAELTADNATMNISTPGWYMLDLSGLTPEEGACVKVTATPHEIEEVGCLPGPFDNPDPCPQLVDTGFIDVVTCAKVYAQVRCHFGELQFPAQMGYIDPKTGEFNMAIRITPASKVPPTCEKQDVLPFDIVGPAGPFTYDQIVTDALAANPADYPTFGPVLATDEILELNAVELDGNNFLFNGEGTPSVNDPDGVNRDNVIEVPDGCTVRVTLCMQQCQDKAGNIV